MTGVVREIDCRFLMHGPLGDPLRDPDYVRQVHVDEESRTIIWPNGLDPATEFLHDLEPADATAARDRTAA
jgi:hypothetical protein